MAALGIRCLRHSVALPEDATVTAGGSSMDIATIVKRKVLLAAANGAVPVSWEDMRAIDSKLDELRELQQLRAQGEVSVVLANGECVAVTRVDDEHRILKVIWQKGAR
jgi:hypothetical protein